MNGIILDTFEEGTSTCFLTKITLHDYINSLSDHYKEYEVQREIVSNTYLDNLVDTILQEKHIPPIVLVVDEEKYQIKENQIIISEFKILDGLQRTFRLKLIWDTIVFFNKILENSKETLHSNRLQLSRKYSSELEKINSNTKILYSIILAYNEKSKHEKNVKIEKCFELNQWFEIWTNLSPKDEVNKMLILNAGHKPVKTQHQLELLFLNAIPIIKKANFQEFELIREKESNSTIFSKNRKKGQFHFAHLITSILSFNQGKPITANVNLVHKAQSTEFDIDEFDNYFNYEFLNSLIESLLMLDDAIIKTYNDLGMKWMGREVSLVGIFAALGAYSKKHNLSPIESLEKISLIASKPEILNLTEYEATRNNLDLSKINIGSVNKHAIFSAILNILNGDNEYVNWNKLFKN